MDINLTPGTREALVNMITTAINEDRYPHADYHELQQLCEYWEKSLLAPPATSTSGATRINSARMDRNPAPCIFCSSKHLKCEPIQGYDNLCKRCQKKGYGECPTSPPLATTRQASYQSSITAMPVIRSTNNADSLTGGHGHFQSPAEAYLPVDIWSNVDDIGQASQSIGIDTAGVVEDSMGPWTVYQRNVTYSFLFKYALCPTCSSEGISTSDRDSCES